MNYINGLELFNSFRDNIPNTQDKYLVDQIFLAQYVYKYIIGSTTIHCSHNGYEPFAKQIDPVETGFVGEVITECPRAAEIMGDTEKKFDRVGAY